MHIAMLGDQPVCVTLVRPVFGHVGKRRISRIVVLPDYQGFGVARKMCAWLGDEYAKIGQRLKIITAQPHFARALAENGWNIRHATYLRDRRSILKSRTISSSNLRNVSIPTMRKIHTWTLEYRPG